MYREMLRVTHKFSVAGTSEMSGLPLYNEYLNGFVGGRRPVDSRHQVFVYTDTIDPWSRSVKPLDSESATAINPVYFGITASYAGGPARRVGLIPNDVWDATKLVGVDTTGLAGGRFILSTPLRTLNDAPPSVMSGVDTENSDVIIEIRRNQEIDTSVRIPGFMEPGLDAGLLYPLVSLQEVTPRLYVFVKYMKWYVFGEGEVKVGTCTHFFG